MKIFVIREQVNRDPISNEMLKMRQQVEYLQAELCARGGGSSSEVQVFISVLMTNFYCFQLDLSVDIYVFIYFPLLLVYILLSYIIWTSCLACTSWTTGR